MSVEPTPSRIIPAADYFSQHYLADFEVFASDTMCGFSLADALNLPKRARFRGLPEFVVCQFNLNLLNQAVYTHAGAAYHAWRAFSAPFADTHKCWLGHGLGSHIPYSILRFAQQPFASAIAPVPLGWDIIRIYTSFFLHDYLTRFTSTASGAGFPRRAFVQAVVADYDCTACVLAPSGWESRHVREFLTHEPTMA